MHSDAGAGCLVYRRERGSPVDRGKPAGVAVRENIHWTIRTPGRRRAYERRTIFADRVTRPNVLLGDRRGLVIKMSVHWRRRRQDVAQTVQRPT